MLKRSRTIRWKRSGTIKWSTTNKMKNLAYISIDQSSIFLLLLAFGRGLRVFFILYETRKEQYFQKQISDHALPAKRARVNSLAS